MKWFILFFVFISTTVCAQDEAPKKSKTIICAGVDIKVAARALALEGWAIDANALDIGILSATKSDTGDGFVNSLSISIIQEDGYLQVNGSWQSHQGDKWDIEKRGAGKSPFMRAWDIFHIIISDLRCDQITYR